MATMANSTQGDEVTANPAQGWRVARVPNQAPYRTRAGRLAVPVWLTHDGVFIADTALVLDSRDIESLHSVFEIMLAAGDLGAAAPSDVPP
ncbi:hypothetical protein [Embleya sp. AB8]|uniref:hypothetical protein n=1 Tax=Embleya sp. AB8 TaxID=3156304 RepID=UPI003C7669F3